MGYTTDLNGQFEFNKTLDIETFNFLKDFAKQRHDEYEDGDNLGIGAWCQWIPTEDGKFLEWDGNEKFYNYIEWLQYIIGKILIPKGFVINGEVTWSGEEDDDLGKIIVKNNKIKIQKGKVTYK